MNESAFVEAVRGGQSELVRRLIAEGADPNLRVRPPCPSGRCALAEYTVLMLAAGSLTSSAATVAALLEGGADPTVNCGGGTAAWFAASGGSMIQLTPPQRDSLTPDHELWNWGGGDVDRLRLLLDAGGDPNEEAFNCYTPLCGACMRGDPERVALLLERGASIWPPAPLLEPVTNTKLSPEEVQGLWLNLEQHLEKVLAGTFEPPSEKECDCHSLAFFQACESGSAACVQLLIDRGFPPDYKCHIDNALSHAGSAEVAQILLDKGLSFEWRPYITALSHALSNGRYEVAELLLASLKEERQDALNHLLLGCRDVQQVRFLLNQGAQVGALVRGNTALHYACWLGDCAINAEKNEVIEILIQAGADVNLLDDRENTPLHEAAAGDWGSPSAISILLSHGAALDAVNNWGWTPLMSAANKGYLECVRLLLSAGADAGITDPEGRTALDLARGHVQVWESIVDGSAGIREEVMPKEDPDKRQARHVEVLATAREVVELLESHAK